jgi:succinate-semialdehyde dehydrogenase/glutarate-semialdehyde dehydrogenase
VSNPANGDVVATLPQMTVVETSAIIEIAKPAQVSWAARTGKDR